ncbi:zf-HC2 domain-containing protein [Tenuibacillus multivorans]|uniref:Anti-sigma-W factor RsiW n=1 Tax=Tenuibacillus multivorans TaxID=237069 RepID=A0A1H0FFH5_9BACI|nr:zf-HC2 domain-containing protein [Tenuibacillus multivorans]GEL77633.1 hypothetical protein TMU01_18680 [Tenuibacillus multivorans]SDN93159.1 Putative zinc-finger [Tenuibacillus multivorans]
MACNQSSENELHRYLNRELNQEEENQLKRHLMECQNCQEHYRELKRLDGQLNFLPEIDAPDDLKHNIMHQLPQDPKVKKFSKIVREHPFIAAAVVFFIAMFSSTLTQYHTNQQIFVSSEEGVIKEGNRVIIPEGEVIEGDFTVKNAELVLEGKIQGNLTLVNSQVVSMHEHQDNFLNSVSHHVGGTVTEIDQYFVWVYHKIEHEFKNIVTFVSP